MEDASRADIRKLLKTFGVQADEAIFKYLLQNPGATPLRIRLTLTDLTEYEDAPHGEQLHLEVEGQVRRD
jgi:hypothetical protein